MSAAFYALEAEAPGSVWDGAYTPAQAQRGETQYKQQCAVCHGETRAGSPPDFPSLIDIETVSYTHLTLPTIYSV